MQCCSTRTRFSMGLGLTLGLVALAAPALAETYSWRTEDGVYAYTDDPKQIPARYAAEAKRVSLRGLQGYERYTAQDAAASDRYSERLAARLEHLRGVNAQAPGYPTTPAPVAAGSGSTAPAISIATGGATDPRIELPVDDAAGPLVVEPVNAKQPGDVVTRRVTVVRQDGRIVAVLKGNPNEYNPSTDILNEEDLDRGL